MNDVATVKFPPAKPPTLLACLYDEIDPSNTSKMAETLEANHHPSIRSVIVDLTGLELLTWAGIGMLHRLCTDWKARGLEIQLITPKRVSSLGCLH